MTLLLSEAAEHGEHSLKRTLGVFQLTALGVGAIIGAGIFVLSGLGAHYAGPGLMLSFVFAGLGCAFAALCYAEFASMIPVAGSAYTYAYATLGEMFAWIIGWDLTLEYAMGAQHGFFRLVESLHRIARHFPYQDAVVAGLRSLDGYSSGAENHSRGRWRRQRIRHSSRERRPSSTSPCRSSAQSPELLQRAMTG